MRYPHIAIIILNWNGLKDTLECLESVFKNNYPNYSVTVVDNASKADELSEIKKFCEQHISTIDNRPSTIRRGGPSTFFIQNSDNLGFSEGNNVGIRKALKAGAEYIFTLNNDTTVDRDFLTAAIQCVQNSPYDPYDPYVPYDPSPIGIVATKMVNYHNRSKLDNVGHDLLTTGDTIPRGRNQLLATNYQLPTTNSPPMGACAGAALYSSKMLKHIGLFDKDFFLNYEDSDLSLRGIVQGWKAVHCEASVIYHKINASIGKIKNTNYRIRSQRNQLWAYLHNTPLLVILLNLPWIILRDLLVILISIMTLRWTITWIFLKSRIEILKTLPQILKKRKKVLKNQAVSSLWFWWQQKSWFITYFQYFKTIIIKRKESVMEN